MIKNFYYCKYEKGKEISSSAMDLQTMSILQQKKYEYCIESRYSH